jgi:hypothetical protein
MARDVYTRRQEGVSIWVAAITASNPDDKGELFDPAADKIYRHPTFYEIPEEVGAPSTCCTWPTTPWCWASATPNGAATAHPRRRPGARQRQPRHRPGRLLYQRVAELKGGDASEDQLAYFRDAHEFRNYTLLELPHHGPLVATRRPTGTTPPPSCATSCTRR